LVITHSKLTLKQKEKKMTAKEFEILFEEATLRSKKLLCKRGQFYAEDENRLENFIAASGAQGIPLTQSVTGMCTKQWVAFCKMAKNPSAYSLAQWREVLIDIRNYTYLAEGCLAELEIK
jgi:hypothetical protein